MSPQKRGSAAWREFGGQRCYFRSKWEANYGRYLEFLRQQGLISVWQHEPETFWFEGIRRGCVSYLPDFLVVLPDGSREYHEVKGWMDAKSATKLKRMVKYFPKVTVKLIGKTEYTALARNAKALIKDWE